MFRIILPIVTALLFIAAAPALMLLITGDFPGSTAFYGLAEDHDVVNFIFLLRGQ